ncbi:UNVERIFIED_CONTAM: hypothetical protein HDU68_004108, partial [Siphonaria sp. JEL0065]
MTSDCWYSHDVSTTVCKYFLQGYCVKGNDCPFLHDEEEINDVWEQHQQYQEYEYYEDGGYGDTEFEYQDQESAFPALAEEEEKERRQQLDFWGPTIAFSDALKKQPVNDDARYRFNVGVAKAAPSGTAVRYLEEQTGKKYKVDGMKWVSTGGEVDALYRKQREEVTVVAEQRNKLFQRAAEAFRSGNTAAAKTFSTEARKLDEAMKKLNQDASAKIYAQRNANISNSTDERIIDLHGLHGDEGIYYLETAMAGLKRERFEGTLTVITGTGNHSRGSFAKVAPQIREYFR